MTVTEVDATGWVQFREIVGGATDSFNCGTNVRCMVHDRGFMLPNQFFWRFIEHPQAFAGKGLVYGTGRDGEMTDLPEAISLAFTMTIVAFLGNEDGFERAIRAGLVDRPASTIDTILPDGSTRRQTFWEWQPSRKKGDG
jgi:hypothetical protein